MTPKLEQHLKALMCEGCSQHISIEEIAGYPSHRWKSRPARICTANPAVLDRVKEAIAATEAATVEACKRICQEFEVVHAAKADESDDEMEDDLEHGMYMAAKELSERMNTLIKTPGHLARREAAAYDKGYQDGQQDLLESNPGPEAI